MTAMALNIAGLYLGSGVASAIGGIVIGASDVRYVPVAAAAVMLLSFLLTPEQQTPGSGSYSARNGERDPDRRHLVVFRYGGDLTWWWTSSWHEVGGGGTTPG